MIAIVGKPRMGKTTLLKWLVLLSPAKQVFILDYHGEFKKIAEMRPNVFLFFEPDNFKLFKEKVFENAARATPSLVILDEIHMYTKTNPDNVKLVSEMYRMAGHHSIILLCATHRIKDMPPDIRGMITEFICFKMTELNDLKELKGHFGEPAAELVKSLGKCQFVHFRF